MFTNLYWLKQFRKHCSNQCVRRHLSLKKCPTTFIFTPLICSIIKLRSILNSQIMQCLFQHLAILRTVFLVDSRSPSKLILLTNTLCEHYYLGHLLKQNPRSLPYRSNLVVLGRPGNLFTMSKSFPFSCNLGNWASKNTHICQVSISKMESVSSGRNITVQFLKIQRVPK